MQVVCKTLCKTWKARSCPLYLTLALSPPLFFFFLLLKNLLRLKINILSPIYPEMNFPAEPVMKINNLSRPKVPGPPSESNGRPLRWLCLCWTEEACLQYKGRVADPAAEVNWGRGSRGPKGRGLRPQEGSSLPPPPPPQKKNILNK